MKERIQPEPKVWRYQLDENWVAMAGKTSFDNELLSLQVALPNDHWFHSANCPGSHVILRGPEGEQPTRDLLEKAAAIAAWHSKERAAGNVRVDCCLAKYVSKPPRSPEGTVTITNVKIMKVKPGLPGE